MLILDAEEHKAAIERLSGMLGFEDDLLTDFFRFEMVILAQAIEDYEKVHFPMGGGEEGKMLTSEQYSAALKELDELMQLPLTLGFTSDVALARLITLSKPIRDYESVHFPIGEKEI